jgi:hypothetical protein
MKSNKEERRIEFFLFHLFSVLFSLFSGLFVFICSEYVLLYVRLDAFHLAPNMLWFFRWLFSRLHSNFCHDYFYLASSMLIFIFTWLRICYDFFGGYFLEYILIFIVTVFIWLRVCLDFFSRGCFWCYLDFFDFVFIIFSTWFFRVLINVIRVKTNNK